MTQVSMTLTFSQGQRSRSNFPYKCWWPWPKWVKNQITVHISEAISHHIYNLLSQLFVTHLGVALLCNYYRSFLRLIWALPSCIILLGTQVEDNRDRLMELIRELETTPSPPHAPQIPDPSTCLESAGWLPLSVVYSLSLLFTLFLSLSLVYSLSCSL